MLYFTSGEHLERHIIGEYIIDLVCSSTVGFDITVSTYGETVRTTHYKTYKGAKRGLEKVLVKFRNFLP
jgi:hypothetical protein